MLERKGLIRFDNKDATIIGEDIKIGQQAPSFKAHLQDWTYLDILKMTRGKVRIIVSVPSVEMEVCNRKISRFNEEAGKLSKVISILIISTDLPYAQKRYCATAGIDQIIVISDHLKTNFGKKYGCLIKEHRVLRNAVFVIDKKYKIIYANYSQNLGDEPDYSEVLETARNAL